MYSGKMHIPAHPNDVLSFGIKVMSIIFRYAKFYERKKNNSPKLGPFYKRFVLHSDFGYIKTTSAFLQKY